MSRSLRLAAAFPRHGWSSSRLLSMPRLLLACTIMAAGAGCGWSGDVVENFADRGLVALAPNIHPAEAVEVAAFMKNTGYPFRALQTNSEWAEEKYGVTGAPTNFIMDPEGRVIHDPGIINSLWSQAEFERWLQSPYDYLAVKQQARPIGTDPEQGSEG